MNKEVAMSMVMLLLLLAVLVLCVNKTTWTSLALIRCGTLNLMGDSVQL